MEQKSVLLEKQIQSLDDLQSVIRLVEEKLKETSNLILLLLEPNDELKNEDYDDVAHHLKVKLEEPEVGENSGESKQLTSNIKEQNIDHDDNKQTNDVRVLGVNLFTGQYLTGLVPKDKQAIEQVNEIVGVNYSAGDTQDTQNLKDVQKTQEKKKRKTKPYSEYKPNRSGFCEICNKNFALLYKHKINVHEKRVWDYTCPICNLEFKSVRGAINKKTVQMRTFSK